jgi:xanthine dehydrogenase accessory factor
MLLSEAVTDAGPAGSAAPEFAETVLPALARWTASGMRTALVSLAGIDGGAPRPIGAQMAVAEDGRAVGYISGGCLEGALIAEARAAMAEGRNRLVRYGAGSPYIDVRLPCGGGLDIYVDQQLPQLFAGEMAARFESRLPFRLETDIGSGTSRLLPWPHGAPAAAEQSARLFSRIYWPQMRLALAGAGPAVPILARLAAEAGWLVDVVTPQVPPPQLRATEGISVRRLHGALLASAIRADAWTAAAVIFHDHEWETPLLRALLRTDCFYIGAVGSRRVHELRLQKLRGEGADEAQLARIRGPAGLIGQTRSPATLAISILAEIAATARDMGYIA